VAQHKDRGTYECAPMEMLLMYSIRACRVLSHLSSTCKQYFSFDNFVIFSFMSMVPIISQDVDFKPDNNYVSPQGQTRLGQAHVKFIVIATRTPTRSGSLTF